MDGIHLTLGPVGAVNRARGHWDALVGAEAGLYWIEEGCKVEALGLNFGAATLSSVDRGRLWLQGEIASRVAGIPLGASAGPVVEIAELAHPRYGAQVAVWVYAGVLPYVRLGQLQRSGRFLEFGLRIPLPTLRWQP